MLLYAIISTIAAKGCTSQVNRGTRFGKALSMQITGSKFLRMPHKELLQIEK